MKDAIHHVLKLDKGKQTSENISDANLETISGSDMMSLNLSWASQPETVLESVFDSVVKEDGVPEPILLNSVQCISKAASASSPLVDACKLTVKDLESKMPAGYQIIGDNLDLHINAKHLTTANKNKSLHNFNMIAIKDDVSGNHLPDHHQLPLCDVAVAEFLPSAEDISKLKSDFIPLWSRIIVKHLKPFSIFCNVVIYHIPHEYINQMKECSEEVSNLKSGV